jgi:hypothetical protein
MASSSDQGISDLILLWLKLELVDPAGYNSIHPLPNYGSIYQHPCLMILRSPDTDMYLPPAKSWQNIPASLPDDTEKES